MSIQDLLNIDPVTLDDENSTYDKVEHMPIPTVEFIFKKTAVDMIAKVGENETDATLRYLTDLTMSYIKDVILPESRYMIEFLIAKSKEHRKAFIDVVASVVSSVRHEGIAEFLKTGKLTKDDMPKLVQAQASSKGLLQYQYREKIPRDSIRKDY